MADDPSKTAKTSLVYDASGMAKGAEEAKAASDKVIAANKAVDASATQTATSVAAASAKQTAAQRAAAQGAADAAKLLAAAAASGGDAVAKAADRAATSASGQTRFLNSLAKSLDPLGEAAKRASTQLETLLDIAGRGGPNAARATSMVADSTDRLLQAQSDMAAGLKLSSAEVQRLTEKFDPAGASAQRMAGELLDLNHAQQAGISIVGGYANAFEKIVAGYDESALAAQKAAAAQKELIQSAQQANAASEASNTGQSMYNQFAGVKESAGSVGGRNVDFGEQTKSAQESAAAFQEVFDAQEKVLAENKALEAEFNPLKAATDKYNDAVGRLQDAKIRGLVTNEQATAQQQRLDQQLAASTNMISKYGQAHSQADFASRQFGVQSVQFFTSIQAGQPIMTAFIQQGHQLLDVALSTGTGFKVLGNAARDAFNAIVGVIVRNPIVAGLVAITGALVAMAYAAESAARRFGTLRNELSATRNDATEAATMVINAGRHIGATTAIGTTEATKAAQIIQSAPQFQGNQQQLEALALSADKLALALGEDIPAAAETLKKALQDPASVASTLKDRLKGFDQGLIDDVKRLQDQGKTAEAFEVVLKAITAATVEVTRTLTPLQEASQRLARTMASGAEAGNSLWEIVGGRLNARLSDLVNAVSWVIEAFEKIASWVAKFAGTGGNTLEQIQKEGGVVMPWNTGSPGGTPLGERLNNPLNLTALPGQAAEGRFRRFDTMDQGVAAAVKQLQINQDTHGTQTLAQQITRWAPPNENDTAAYIARVAKEVGIDPNAPLNTRDADLIKKVVGSMAKVEIGKPIDQAALDKGVESAMQAGGPAPLNKTASGAANRPQDVVSQALTLADQSGTAAVTRSKAWSDIQLYQEALQKIDPDKDADKFTRVSQALQKAQVAFQDAVEPAVKLVEQTDREVAGQGRLADAYGKGDQAIAYTTARNKALEEARTLAAQGTEVNAQLVDQLTQKYLALGNATQKVEFAKFTADTDIQIAAQNRLITAYEKGPAAVMQMQASIESEAKARELARAGLADYATALEVITQKNVELAQTKARAELAPQITQNNLTAEMYNKEAEAIGMDYEQHVRYVAILQTEMTLKAKGLPTNDAFAESLKKSAADAATAAQHTQEVTAAYNEIAGSLSSSFDTIGNSITQALVSGQGAAVNFRNVLTSVAQQILQSFLKLAVLNPLLNSLFPGSPHRSTFGDAWDAINKVSPGTSSTSGGESSAGGILGKVIGWAGSLFGGSSDPFASSVPTAATEAISATDALSSTGLGGGFLGGMKYHEGGFVGINDNHPMVWMSPQMLLGAPKYASGLGANEFAAILHRGEVVLNDRQQHMISAAANGNAPSSNHTFVFNFPSTTNPDGFRRAGQQVANQVASTLGRSQSRNGTGR